MCKLISYRAYKIRIGETKGGVRVNVNVGLWQSGMHSRLQELARSSVKEDKGNEHRRKRGDSEIRVTYWSEEGRD